MLKKYQASLSNTNEETVASPYGPSHPENHRLIVRYLNEAADFQESKVIITKKKASELRKVLLNLDQQNVDTAN